MAVLVTKENQLFSHLSYIFHLTHLQWIFRNVTLHDSICCTLWFRKQEELLREIESLLETDSLEEAYFRNSQTFSKILELIL